MTLHLKFSSLAASLALLTWSAGGAAAAPTIVGTYWTESLECSLSGFDCTKGYSTIPIGKKLFVTDISCVIQHTVQGAFVTSVNLHPSTGGTPSFFAPVKTGFFGINNNYALSEKANVLILGGQHPRITTSVTGGAIPNIKSRCTISGIYTNFP